MASSDPGPSSPDLLSRYRAGDWLFAAPGGAWLGRGSIEDYQGPTGAASDWSSAAARLRDQASRMLQHRRQAGAPGLPVLLGAVPFDLREPALLRVPAQLWRGSGCAVGATAAAPAEQPVQPAQAPRQTTPRPAVALFEHAVAEALQRIAQGRLDKVVLSRQLELQLATDTEPQSVLQRLARRHPRGYIYAVPLAAAGTEPAGCFVGASPELLVRRQGRTVRLNPLAGSTARHPDAATDARAAQVLLASPKDRHEHALVIDAVAAALRPLCRSLDVPAQPELLATDALWHLSTRIQGELADPATSALDLALALHPTPAVCGWPPSAAFEAIAQLETQPRGLFAGFVGWCDANGDGEWAVSLRCAELRGPRVRLQAGAGVVAGSTPARESAEIDTKFRTMLSALGVASTPG